MSTPEHLGPQDPKEKLKFIVLMITRAKAKDSEYPEGSYSVGQGSLHTGSLGNIRLINEPHGVEPPP
eukprot:12891643-Prorocentrum_lima.AAC.1